MGAKQNILTSSPSEFAGISVSSLLTILAFLALVWFWLDSLRAREVATEIFRTVYKQRGLQLLDQAVFLLRLGIRRTNAGLRIRRVYV